MSKYSFPKSMRLLTPMSFNFVFQNPQRISIFPITILARLNLIKYPRIGFAISKKNVKKAHDRNRIKRLIRENFRLHQHELSKMDFVILVKTGIIDFNNKVLINILEKLWYHYYLVKYSDA